MTGHLQCRVEPWRSARGPWTAAMALTAMVACLFASSSVWAQTKSCPNAAIRKQQRTTWLPDCRAYEQVTPKNKGDYDAAIDGSIPAWPADTGNALYYNSNGAFAGAGSSFGGQSYAAIRESSGWKTTAVTAAAARGNYAYYGDLASTDLSRVAVQVEQGDHTIPPHLPVHMYLGPAGGPYRTMAEIPPDSFANMGQDYPIGASPDLNHVALQVAEPAALSPPATGTLAGDVLYDWSPGGLRLVSVGSDGKPLPCGAVLGNGNSSYQSGQINTVSADGSRVFFLSPDPSAGNTDPSCASLPSQLYVWNESTGTSIQVSAPQPGVVDPDGPQSDYFIGASEDGSKVFFETTQELTADDTTHDPELYEYNLSAHTLTRVSRGDSGTADGNVQWAIVSPDGSVVYLVTLGQMVPGTGTAGQPNLYRYNTVSGTYAYVGTLTHEDVVNHYTISTPGPGDNAEVNWYITPNSRYLLFASGASLTPSSPPADTAQEIYRYDAKAGSLKCVSCPPPGISANGDAEFTHFAALPTGLSYYNRPITNNGQTVFFDSPTELLPQASNGKRNVYEWHAGRLSLLTPGDGASDAYFVGSAHGGRDVFISTHDPLLAQDRDGLSDIYDARVDGGFRVRSTRQATRTSDHVLQR